MPSFLFFLLRRLRMRGKYKSFYAMCKNGVHATTTYDAHEFGFLYLSPMAKKLRTGEGMDEKKIPAAEQLLSTKNFAVLCVVLGKGPGLVGNSGELEVGIFATGKPMVNVDS